MKQPFAFFLKQPGPQCLGIISPTHLKTYGRTLHGGLWERSFKFVEWGTAITSPCSNDYTGEGKPYLDKSL